MNIKELIEFCDKKASDLKNTAFDCTEMNCDGSEKCILYDKVSENGCLTTAENYEKVAGYLRELQEYWDLELALNTQYVVDSGKIAGEVWRVWQEILLPERDGGLSFETLNNIFGTHSGHKIAQMSFWDVKKLYDKWLKSLEYTPKVGDEVALFGTEQIGIVFATTNSGTIKGIIKDPKEFKTFSAKKGEYKFTGNHNELIKSLYEDTHEVANG